MSETKRNWLSRLPDLGDVISRFPAVTAIMAVFAGIFVVLGSNIDQYDELAFAMIGLVIAAYIGVMITVARAAKGQSNLWPVQLLIAAAFFALFWFTERLRINPAMAMGAVLLALGNAVLWRRARNDIHLWDFTHKIWTGAAFATLGSIIFTLGIFAILAALKSLFGIKLDDLAEHILFPIGLAFLAPLYWLSTVPAVDEPYDELYENPGFVSKAVAFLGTWLLSPLTLIYALILLAYAVKIVMAWDLPKGEIAALTLPFLLIGALTWLLLEPPFIQTKALAKLFRKLWWPISIPAAIMLAISIFVRVREFGLTEERIAIILAVIWALGLAAWFTFAPKEKRDIRLIPGVASGLLLLGTFTAQPLSVMNQSARLESYLEQLVPMADKELALARKTKGAMQYLWRIDAKDRVRKSVRAAGLDVEAKASLNDMFESLSIKDLKMPSRYSGNTDDRLEFDYGNEPVRITGYDQYYRQSHYTSFKVANGHKVTDVGDIEISLKSGKLSFKKAGKTVGEFDLMAYVYDAPVTLDTIQIPREPVVIYEDDDIKIAMLIRRASRWTDDDASDAARNGNARYDLLSASKR